MKRMTDAQKHAYQLQSGEFNNDFVKNIIKDIPEESIKDIHKLVVFVESLTDEFVNHLNMQVCYDLKDGNRKMILNFNGGWFCLRYKNRKRK
jgi:hypothetical protein